jgi:hypothetical protein
MSAYVVDTPGQPVSNQNDIQWVFVVSKGLWPNFIKKKRGGFVQGVQAVQVAPRVQEQQLPKR